MTIGRNRHAPFCFLKLDLCRELGTTGDRLLQRKVRLKPQKILCFVQDLARASNRFLWIIRMKFRSSRIRMDETPSNRSELSIQGELSLETRSKFCLKLLPARTFYLRL